MRSRVCWMAALVGSVGLTQASAGGPIEEALAATFRITNGRTSATCFLVGPDEGSTLLVTAGHFFDQVPEPDCTLILRSEQPDGSFARREVSIPIRDGEKQLWTKHAKVDVAALTVTLPEGASVARFRPGRIADEGSLDARKVRVGQDVYIPGFPAQLEANPAGWPVLRKGMIASHPLTPVKFAKSMLIDAKTFGGDSGAPVVAVVDGEPLVVGVVVGMQRQTDRVTSPFEERTTHMPLGIALAVPAAFVREVVEPDDARGR